MVSDPHPSTFRSLWKLWGHLARRRRLQLALLLLVMLASGLAELVSLGAVLPFLAVLSNPEQLWQQRWIQSLALSVGYSQPHQLVMPITLAFVLSAVLAALIRLMNLWLNSRLAAAVGSDLSCEAYKRTLYQPYQVHVRQNSSTLISAITQQIAFTVESLNMALQIMTASVVAIGLLFGILLINPFVALSAAGIFGIAYSFVAIQSRRKLHRIGVIISEANTQRIKALQEGLGAIRDVLLDGSQATYLELYSRTDRHQRLVESKVRFISAFPRYILECLGLVFIAVLGAILASQLNDVANVLTLLGGLALGAQRLLPALQQIYSGWANLKSWNPCMVGVIEMLEQPMPKQQSAVEPFVLCENIRLQGLHFAYFSGSPNILSDLDLEIRFGERIGLIGATGSGKSTLVDILMGLLVPSSGRYLVDGVDLHDPGQHEALAAWRKAVAHVPQTIFLSDSSIAENIAFGVPRDLIDMSRVKEAAKRAKLTGFIESNPKGYDSHVGERGVRLSGGQRQRIGIARALYKSASIIFLDEATSALDNDTEEAVMESVEGLSRNLTIIMVAHRLSTIQRCDRVVRLDHGKIISIGSPGHILGLA